MATDLFEKLRGFSWRGIGAPITSMRLVLRQDLAQHKFVGRPGADVEATGRAPFEITATIPFFNNIEPGPNESWTAGTLYPNVWKQYLAAMADTSTGDLTHPELGTIRCKPREFDTDWQHSTRGGVPCNVSWLETTDDPNALASLIAAVSPLAGAIQAASDIDTHLGAIQPPLPDKPEFKPSFADAMRAVQGVFDQAGLLARRQFGMIDEILYRVNAIEFSMSLAARQPGNGVASVLNWPMRDALQRMKSSANDLKKTLITGKKAIGIFIPSRAGTMGKLATDIHASMTDLLLLNPSLVANPIVPAGSKVRFYIAA